MSRLPSSIRHHCQESHCLLLVPSAGVCVTKEHLLQANCRGWVSFSAYSAWCYARLSLWVMQDHLTGKQYLGWKAIRDEQARLQEQLANQRLPPPPSRPTEDARPSHREREREREPRRDRERERLHSSRDQHRSRQPSDREAENGRRSSSHSHRERSPTRSGCMGVCHCTWCASVTCWEHSHSC